MSKHCFAPRLTDAEYATLSTFSATEKEESHSDRAARLADRGLLRRHVRQTYKRVGLDDIATINRLSLTQRGLLMLQRYQKQRNHLDTLAIIRAESAA